MYFAVLIIFFREFQLNCERAKSHKARSTLNMHWLLKTWCVLRECDKN